MDSQFIKYITILVMLLATILIPYLIKRKRKLSKKNETVVVKGGSLSIFFDKTGNVTIIPYVKDKYGNGKATAHIEFLEAPFSPDKLGRLAKNSMNASITGVSCSNKELIDLLKVNDWKQFSENRKNISLYFKDGFLIFNTTTRKLDGAYQFNYNGVEHKLPADTIDEILGNTILQLRQRCR